MSNDNMLLFYEYLCYKCVMSLNV